MKGQPGFWNCISACVPFRPAPESDREPERSQYLAEQAALLVRTSCATTIAVQYAASQRMWTIDSCNALCAITEHGS